MAYAGAATSQTPPPADVDNQQVQLGDVFATQTLNVVDQTGDTAAATTATGNSFTVGADGVSLNVTSSQTLLGDVGASATLTGTGQLGSNVTMVTEAVGNGGEAATYNADLDAGVTQTVTSNAITASTTIDAPTGRIMCCGSVSTTALGNAQAYGVVNGTATTSTTQTNTAQMQATTTATVQYMPSPNVFSSAAVANSVAGSGTNSTQTVVSVQSMSGAAVQASTGVFSGNAWDVTGAATVTANTTSYTNQGGSLAVTTDQSNTSALQATTDVVAYDFGAATSTSFAIGNTVLAGENGGYLDLDNSQMNSGGVGATATFTGQDGYDAYGSAVAQGNAVTGYACSECQATVQAVNRQTNDGDVNATTQITVNGQARAMVGNATAVGNSATVYVTRQGN